ncbi:MAG: hypothetical protein KDE47_09590 [Caldilineaceae bacterium]|nr:hypothetical protein [Caldilineaceae bacterium]
MTTRELLIQEIEHAPDDLVQLLLRYIRAEQQRRQATKADHAAQTLGPFADYWNQFIGAAGDEPWERPAQGTLEQREAW